MRVFLKLTWIEIKLLSREPLTLIFTFALPLLILLVLGGIWTSSDLGQGPGLGGRPAIDWYVPAYIGLVAASIGLISLPVHLASYRERGVLRRLRASGVSEWSILGSQLLVSLGIGIVGAVFMAVEGGVVYDASAPVQLPAFALAYMTGIAMFAAIGILLSAIIPSARAVQGLGLMLWFLMLFLCGPGSPLELLPTWLLRLGQALPLYHVVLALEYPWNGLGMNVVHQVVVGIGTVVVIVLAVRLFRWE